MSGSVRKLSLTSYDDIFSTEETRANEHRESVQQIPLTDLYPFKNHPFQVRDDERMQETAESIKEYGVLVPAIARPREGGGYELVAGHRRKRACELAGLDTRNAPFPAWWKAVSIRIRSLKKMARRGRTSLH